MVIQGNLIWRTVLSKGLDQGVLTVFVLSRADMELEKLGEWEPWRQCGEVSTEHEKNYAAVFLYLNSKITHPSIPCHVLISKTFPNEDLPLF